MQYNNLLAWREYQKKLKAADNTKKRTKKILKYSVILFFLFVPFYCLFTNMSCHHGMLQKNSTSVNNKGNEHSDVKGYLNKKKIQTVLGNKSLLNLTDNSFSCYWKRQHLRVNTSINVSLQQYILKKIKLDTTKSIGIVVMNPSTGEIISMVGYDKTGMSKNPCIDSRFPAASVFKIVTAAAAIETCGLNSKSLLKYNGGKYTLYKSQLKNKTNKYTHSISLRESFAKSINPVFGKIGIYYLGKNTLSRYASAFGFNRNINFEIQLSPSSISLSDKPFHLAEIASGYNRKTMISPMHGALMIAAIFNHGMLIEPSIVKNIIDDNGDIIYSSHLTPINHAITDKSSQEMIRLLRATITSGTCRKTFRGYKKDRVLSKLDIGGKTGTINNNIKAIQYDWFVGFAEDKGGGKQLVISIVVEHEKYIGIKASQYARFTIKKYFDNYFVQMKKKYDNNKKI